MLSLDGQSLEGMGHREAAELLAKAPSVVTFSVWREEGEKEGGRFVYDVFDLNVSVFFSQLLKVLPAL